jgi:hypothetical protein
MNLYYKVAVFKKNNRKAGYIIGIYRLSDCSFYHIGSVICKSSEDVKSTVREYIESKLTLGQYKMINASKAIKEEVLEAV